MPVTACTGMGGQEMEGNVKRMISDAPAGAADWQQIETSSGPFSPINSRTVTMPLSRKAVAHRRTAPARSSRQSYSFPPQLKVELNSPRGNVFVDSADNVELQTNDGTVSFGCDGEAFMSLHERARVRLRIGSRLIGFLLENAVGTLRSGTLSILAEKVRRCEPRI